MNYWGGGGGGLNMIYGVILAPSSPFIKSYNGHTFLSYFKEPEIEEKPTAKSEISKCSVQGYLFCYDNSFSVIIFI